ncbi:acyl--CoA ligase [Frankia sp. CNm7]|uniref:Acyl--CoA ligase n=1 Tax=Frankia nepalensis TaxID=1836974 RepID=A0A937URM3_9ACTN|nr:class I adenylate-forming enzyme family protein [Frankia nepalensis]MBL7501079.1 acyl--CoA ligase [Frankia nepalensis]MBL7514716.1 acyl--CoA ligase [Frankia nepalensis]MBL7524567.1 acyl--CoA ligase [Frankia nepalensis]MBL7631273.1 acyl--CoA ligase [Frankia nepalensis]
MTAPAGDPRAALVAPGSYFEVADEDVRGVRMPVFRHRIRSLRELLAGTARFGERTYLVEGDVRVGFATHLEYVDALAAALQDDYRLRPGERVAIYAANRWEWIVAFWAVATAGAIPATYNGWWTPDEFAYATGLVEPSLVIGDSRRLERAAEAGATPPVLDLDEVPAIVEARRGARPAPVSVDEDDPAVLIFTSGTTGRPKAVTIGHRGLCGALQLAAFGETLAMVARGGAVPAAGDTLPAHDDVVLMTSPLFHTSMLFGVVLRAVVRGFTGVLLPGRFDPERVLAAIERERVTSWLALGGAAARVCAVPGRERYDTASLRHMGVGGAPVSPAVQRAIRDTFPGVANSLSIGYASTESVAVVANLAGPALERHPASTGRPSVTTRLELRDPAGVPVPEGTLGEVHVRSPYLMLGYWDDPAASAAVLRDDGWLAMGDVGRVVDGLLYIDSRARDLILVNAENVAPTEVEHRLEDHPEVLEAAVFAVDDEVTGDGVCAAVVTGPDAKLDGGALDAWCRAALAHYKVPTRWHLVTEPLPRTATGKLLKHEIRALVTGEKPSQYI